jgi:hypothetical protein
MDRIENFAIDANGKIDKKACLTLIRTGCYPMSM